MSSFNLIESSGSVQIGCTDSFLRSLVQRIQESGVSGWWLVVGGWLLVISNCQLPIPNQCSLSHSPTPSQCDRQLDRHDII